MHAKTCTCLYSKGVRLLAKPIDSWRTLPPQLLDLQFQVGSEPQRSPRPFGYESDARPLSHSGSFLEYLSWFQIFKLYIHSTILNLESSIT